MNMVEVERTYTLDTAWNPLVTIWNLCICVILPIVGEKFRKKPPKVKKEVVFMRFYSLFP